MFDVATRNPSVEVPSITDDSDTWESEMDRVIARSRHATLFLADQIRTFARHGCWDRTALWTSITQAQCEFADLFGRSPRSVLLEGRARLKEAWRVMALSDAEMMAQLARRFFAPFAPVSGSLPRLLLDRGIGWCAPGLFGFGFADLRVFGMPDGTVAWLCQSAIDRFAGDESGLFIVQGLVESLAGALSDPNGPIPTLRDQQSSVIATIAMKPAPSTERRTRLVHSGVGGLSGRRLSVLSQSRRIDAKMIGGRLAWLAWDLQVDELPEEPTHP